MAQAVHTEMYARDLEAARQQIEQSPKLGSIAIMARILDELEQAVQQHDRQRVDRLKVQLEQMYLGERLATTEGLRCQRCVRNVIGMVYELI